MQKFTIINTVVFDRCIGSSSLLLLPFSYDFRTSNTDATPNSRDIFLYVSHECCLHNFNDIVKYGDVIENVISDALLCNFHLSLIDCF